MGGVRRDVLQHISITILQEWMGEEWEAEMSLSLCVVVNQEDFQ